MMTDKFSTTTAINSKPGRIWTTLTNAQLMTKWIGDPEMKIEVETEWKVNSPIFIRGFHHVEFENKGTILRYDKEKKLSYTHLSSISRLPDKAENYTILEFTLTPDGNSTLLTLDIVNFPTESIRKHLEFYWRTTILTIKDVIERQTN
jgi:uncharacterized protein YndB with AHSA1/START domain